MCVLRCVHKFHCMYMYGCMMGMYVCVYVSGVYGCMFMWVHGLGCVLQRVGAVWWDPDPLQETQIRARYGSDTLAVRRPTHGMIRRFISVRVVKIRRRYGFKTASFHVSVCSCAIFFNYHCHWISVFYSYYFMWPFDILYQHVYLYHFMRYQWPFTVFILMIWAFISIISCVDSLSLLA